MSTGYFVTIRLDEFLQRFLRGYFNCHDIVFDFPNGAYLVKSLQCVLSPVPGDYKPVDYGNESFRIHIPKSQTRNPYTYNYLSEAAEKAFRKKIRDFFDMVFHERVSELRRAGYEKKECVDLFIDENNLSPDDYDRLIKDFQRWRNKLNNREWRKNTKKNSPKKRAKRPVSNAA